MSEAETNTEITEPAEKTAAAKTTRKRAVRKSSVKKQRPKETLRTERNDILWREGQNLPYVEPREGYVQRWIRVDIDGNRDVKNIYKRQNQGWRPRLANTIPEGVFLPSIKFDKQDIVGMHDNVLMERSIELNERYHALNREDIELQNQAIANDVMKFHDAESGLRGRQSGINSQVHKGRVPDIAPDD